MLFNSIDFAIFLPLVFGLYWFANSKSLKLQNLIIVFASYLFYGWWDWRFISLIAFSTVTDYIVSNQIFQQKTLLKKKVFLGLSVVVNIGLLGVFKYYNFFVDNFIHGFTLLGKSFDIKSLNIILPVGISFYTFQTLGYTIDVYRNKIKPSNDLISFAAFVSFFPQLVAGPIERASNLLPQFNKKRNFNYYQASDGLRQMLWGLFKKVVIADNCAQVVDVIFNNYSNLSGSTLLLGSVLFTFQIYCDFSGYSDLAIGTAKLFGFKLRQNFAFPYFSRDIAEFWRRWHISLSSWFRDYIYIPLGGNRKGKWKTTINILLVFMISGLWHGPNWTFLIWGLVHALLIMPLMLLKINRKHLDIAAPHTRFPKLTEIIKMGYTFILVVLTFIIFRSNSIFDSWAIITKLFSASLFTMPLFFGVNHALITLLFIGLMMLIEWFGRKGQYGLDYILPQWKKSYRFAFYYFLIIVIFSFGGPSQQFIYFQF